MKVFTFLAVFVLSLGTIKAQMVATSAVTTVSIPVCYPESGSYTVSAGEIVSVYTGGAQEFGQGVCAFHVSSAGYPILGISQNSGISGDTISVLTLGISSVPVIFADGQPAHVLGDIAILSSAGVVWEAKTSWPSSGGLFHFALRSAS